MTRGIKSNAWPFEWSMCETANYLLVPRYLKFNWNNIDHLWTMPSKSNCKCSLFLGNSIISVSHRTLPLASRWWPVIGAAAKNRMGYPLQKIRIGAVLQKKKKMPQTEAAARNRIWVPLQKKLNHHNPTETQLPLRDTPKPHDATFSLSPGSK